jgi:hypothetical protein
MQTTLDGSILTESMENRRKSKYHYNDRSKYSIPAFVIVENAAGPLESEGFF